MKVKINVFAGMRPQQSTDLLQAGEAVSSYNVRLTNGEIEPYRGLGVTGSGVTLPGAAALSIYRFGQLSTDESIYWFQWPTDADGCKGQIDNDTTERTYWTDGVYPKKTNAALATVSTPYPTNYYQMGIPAPASACVSTVTGTPTRAADPVETVIYCYTYVSAWGEEGPPSPVSTSTQWQPGQTQNITSMATAPSGNYNIVSKRLYRSATGTNGTAFQLVDQTDIPVATTTYTDTLLTAALGETLITTNFFPPPANMIGLTNMANGIMAGFFGNTLCFCEPFLPYAWPTGYQQATDSPIVGIGAFDQSLFVGTTQGAYVFTGTDPASMSNTKLPTVWSCVAKRSVVSMMGGVIYASPEGLIQVTATGIVNLTADLMTYIDWQAYNPSSITAYESDGRYIAFYNTGSVQGGMIFSFGDNPTFSLTTVYALAAYRDKKRDALYLNQSNVIMKWDALGVSPLTYDWLSGVFKLPSTDNFGFGRLDAAAYPVTFKLWADNAVVYTYSVPDQYPFRMPSGFRSRRYQIELIGTPNVREVCIASMAQELD